MKYLTPHTSASTLIALAFAQARAEATLPECLQRPNDLYYAYEMRQGRRYARSARDEDEHNGEKHARWAMEHFARIR